MGESPSTMYKKQKTNRNRQIKQGYSVFIAAVWLVINSSFIHPYYISITELKYTSANQTIEISCRMFADNTEEALKKVYNQAIDLIHPKNKVLADSLLAEYIQKRLRIKVDTRTCNPHYIGYETEAGTVWSYFEVVNIKQLKKIQLENTLLYDFLPAQTNIVHVTVDEKRQSKRLNNPESTFLFAF